MEIEMIDDGFREVIANGIVDTIECSYDGMCRVWYCDGSVHSLDTVCSVYNRQYGVPVSNDGKLMFVGSWETGLYAYDIRSGTVAWHAGESRITTLIVYDAYVIACKYGAKIMKLAISDGKSIAHIASRTVDQLFAVAGAYILAPIRGTLCIINTDDMRVTKRYAKERFNPSGSLSQVILGAEMDGMTLRVHGFEECIHRSSVSNRPFARIIDANCADWLGM